MIPHGLLISAPSSGTGKTTLMLGLLSAFRRQGLEVQPFKSGPDYIDPAFHAAASGRASVNLDSWAMGPADIIDLVRSAKDSDLALAEGSMGLFDGVATPGETGIGASADIAALMGWPVVLVIDVSGQAQSAAAVARGFATIRNDVSLAGVVLNRVASPRHEALVRAGMEAAGMRVFGALPRRTGVSLPERHLGLVQAEEHTRLAEILSEAGEFISSHVDLIALRAAARGAQSGTLAARSIRRPPGQRIALARDVAFSFIYPHLLSAWRSAGAEVLPFSPLRDEGPDPTADVCWLPGGYPELHAGRIAAASRFRAELRAFGETRAVHGECGGYMTLGTGLIDAAGERHEMVGLLGLVTSFQKRRMHLGYRVARLIAAVPGHHPGVRLRGHEFHYATVIEQPDASLAHVEDAAGTAIPETGSFRVSSGGGLCTGSFFHHIAEAT